MELLRRRLRNQRLDRSELRKPAEVVQWLGAVQAQDYSGAKWAIGLRAKGVMDGDVERAFDEGAILRTHVLRPTWHFVSPADIRWMLALTAPRARRERCYLSRVRARRHGLSPQSKGTRARARGREGAHARGARLHSSARRNCRRWHTTRGPDDRGRARRRDRERSPEGKAVHLCPSRRARAPGEAASARGGARRAREALAELAKRYFSSHGPATLRDFAWWSGLTVRDAKAGIESVAPALVEDVVDGRTYWFVGSRAPAPEASRSVHLLPNYDEYWVAYKDRGPVAGGSGRDAFVPALVLDGRIVGSWRRVRTRGTMVVEATARGRLTRAQALALASSAERYGRFLGAPVQLIVK